MVTLWYKVSLTVRVDESQGKKAATMIGCSVTKNDDTPILASDFWEIVSTMPKCLGIGKKTIDHPGKWKWSDDNKTMSILLEVEEPVSTPTTA
jgi:hypothetical protein